MLNIHNFSIVPLNLRYIGAGTELEVQVRRGKVKKIKNKKTKKRHKTTLRT